MICFGRRSADEIFFAASHIGSHVGATALRCLPLIRGLVFVLPGRAGPSFEELLARGHKFVFAPRTSTTSSFTSLSDKRGNYVAIEDLQLCL